MEFVEGLQCTNCGKMFRAEPDRYLCDRCGDEGILDVKYHYDAIRRNWGKSDLESLPNRSIWRYQPLLPIIPQTPKPPLRVGWTPMYRGDKLGREIGLRNLWIKDDGLNPTASLKDRASSVAVVKAQEAGKSVIACSSTGNAASSLAGNVASMGGVLESVIFVPERAPGGKIAQLRVFGATVVVVNGSYAETTRLSSQAIKKWGWYNRNAAINPYLVEGKKTVSLELAEQLNWNVPDWVVVSVGDGCTIAGVWKGFYDLKNIGFIDRLPRLIGVQAEGCAPITKAFLTNSPLEVEKENTIADSIAVGDPGNYRKALRAVRDSGGTMVNVSDTEILDMIKLLGRTTGVFGEPAGVAGLAGLKRLVLEGTVKPNHQVAAIVTGNGLKDIKSCIDSMESLEKVDPDLEELEKYLGRKGLF